MKTNSEQTQGSIKSLREAGHLPPCRQARVRAGAIRKEKRERGISEQKKPEFHPNVASELSWYPLCQVPEARVTAPSPTPPCSAWSLALMGHRGLEHCPDPIKTDGINQHKQGAFNDSPGKPLLLTALAWWLRVVLLEINKCKKK